MYQQNILGIVRDKIQLYEMQTNVEQLRNGFVVGFKVPESQNHSDDKEL
jgi:hypothetical protein